MVGEEVEVEVEVGMVGDIEAVEYGRHMKVVDSVGEYED